MSNICDTNSEKDSWRNRVVTCALAYANHKWRSTRAHMCHDYDEVGVLVNTPDIHFTRSKYNCGWWLPEEMNQGVPYNCGGCSTIEEFDAGIETGKYAGNVPDSRDNGVSKFCVGVDCSGLVTICWGLEKRISTRSILNIATPLESMDLLLPGDIILLPGSHVMIFINFIDKEKTRVQIIDASRSTGRVLLREVVLSELINQGYRGFRKN